MIKRMMTMVLAAVMALMGLTGCEKTEPQPVIPETPELPGTLVGVNYATGGGMMAHSEFHIILNRQEVEYTEFWPEVEYTEFWPEDYVEDINVREHVPITQQQWTDVETVILDLYLDGMLEAYRPKSEPENNPMDAFILDGGDYTNLSLIWETAGGTEEIGYYWPGDRRVLTLIDLLKELADPQGREINRYEKAELDKIYFTRKHRLYSRRDFSFQLHWADYDDEDPHWELIYYLGKHGAVDKGRIWLEQSDWDAFFALAQELKLEYFPEPTRSDDYFQCRLQYTDQTYKKVILNKDTESLLKNFFIKLVNQQQ